MPSNPSRHCLRPGSESLALTLVSTLSVPCPTSFTPGNSPDVQSRSEETPRNFDLRAVGSAAKAALHPPVLWCPASMAPFRSDFSKASSFAILQIHTASTWHPLRVPICRGMASSTETDRGSTPIVVGHVTIVLASIVVVLRFISRGYILRVLGLTDIAIAFSLVTNLVGQLEGYFIKLT